MPLFWLRPTTTKGNEVWVNPDAISRMERRDEVTWVWMLDGGEPLRVTDTPEEISNGIGQMLNQLALHQANGLMLARPGGPRQ